MKTKTQATRTGQAILKNQKGKGWKLAIWENLGWHCCAYNGPLTVYHDEHNNTYSCLLADHIPPTNHRAMGGSGRWLNSNHYTHPQTAVNAQIQIPHQTTLHKYHTILKQITNHTNPPPHIQRKIQQILTQTTRPHLRPTPQHQTSHHIPS